MNVNESVIMEIADKLGMATEEIYTIFVAAQPVIAMLIVICVIFTVLCGYVGYIIFKRYSDDTMDKLGVFMITMILSIIPGRILYEVLYRFLLPEHAAITELIKLLL